MKYYAHTKDGESQKTLQLLEDHLKAVAQLSQLFADDFGAGQWAYLAGLWHDIGKYSLAFQNRLGMELDPDACIEQISGKPDHSTAWGQTCGRISW